LGRDDLGLKEHGAPINARMGLNSWAAFAGNDADAQVAGDIAMRASEVNPVLKALRSRGLKCRCHPPSHAGYPAERDFSPLLGPRPRSGSSPLVSALLWTSCGK